MRLSADTALLVTLLAALSALGECAWGFGSSDAGKVLLRDVQVLTLRAGHKTTGRRSSPVPQTKCVGGTAEGQFTPQVVQCYNRGWDGNDVQWECKTDMDNAFRFGSVEVVCEGYDYPEDPYILKGSCGLEYTLDYTMEGNQRKTHDYYGGGAGQQSYGGNNYYDSYKKSSSGGLGDLILLLVAGGFVYFLYKTCISNGQQMGDRQYSSTSDDYPGGSPGGGGWFGGRTNQAGHGGGYGGYADNDAACGANRQRGTGAGAGGGFWTGLATGGLMGYMFGNRGGRGYGYQNYYGAQPQPRYGGGFGGLGGGWGTGGGGGGSSGSTGTRTASGFGGTRRR